MTRQVLVGIAAVVLAIAGALLPAPAASAGPADDIHSLVNSARWANGQNGLLRNAAMDQVAANWAATMAANGTLSHNPNYSSEIPGGWVAAAENVAQGHPSGGAMHEGWMNSSGHRANVLGDYTDIGIAFLESGGTTWGVQVFANYPGHVGPAPPAPPAPAPAAPEPAPAAPAPDPVDETATPPPTATPTPSRSTRSATPEPRAETTARDADAPAATPPWWPVAVGVALVVGAGAIAVRRRRT